MGLFQKKVPSKVEPLYRIGSAKTLLIVGLGNPGKEYEGTRHNIGFKCVDYLAGKMEFPEWVNKKDLKCQLSQQIIAGSRVILVKPTTYMNLSGEAAQAVQHFYKIPNQDTVVVYDELAIPFGQIRTRTGGSDAGHNGVKSLIEHLGEDFSRVRIGIANKVSEKADSAEFVLGKFSKEEQAEIPNLLQESNAVLSEYIHRGSLTTETRSFVV